MNEETRTNTQLEAPSAEQPEPLMIALGQAKNYHHKADVYLSDGQLEPAIEAVRSILSVRFPERHAAAEEVKLDARARLAKLLITAGKLDEALAAVDEGVTGGARDSFFLANLYAVRADVLEARATSTESAEEARELKRQAIDSLDLSISINQRLLAALASEEVER